MLAFPARLEGGLHSLSFLHLLHTDLRVLVSMDWLCDFGLGAAPLQALCFTETPHVSNDIASGAGGGHPFWLAAY